MIKNIHTNSIAKNKKTSDVCVLLDTGMHCRTSNIYTRSCSI